MSNYLATSRGAAARFMRFAACLAVAGCALVQHGAAVGAGVEGAIGYVVRVDGRWSLDGDEAALSAGKELPPGGLVRNRSGNAWDRIDIADLSGRIILKGRCDARGCGEPLRLPARKQTKASPLTSLIGAVMKLWRGEPEKYSVHIIRGADTREGVLRLTDGGVDLGPVLAKGAAGKYSAGLRPVRLVGGAGESAGAEGRWKLDGSGLLRARIQQGLYELSLVEEDGPDGAPDTAWLLVLESPRYERAAASFSQAQDLSNTWDAADVGPEARRAFLRACLSHLASSE